ncbi:PBP1A family penicillin-binding protein [Candidatus Parcubacteria bacterium]|nr:PBP1A family penicillin-binding protein [Candidatus Parcubacteria bacterium]
MKERRAGNLRRNRWFIILSILLFVLGGGFLWLATLRLPSLDDLSDRKVVQSAKIYDRTGTVLLYDMSQDILRTQVPFENISKNIKDATLAIEDKDFYNHGGIKISSIMRAIFVNVATLSFNQGGSTITQQVVKNTILTNDKTPTRKLKEWILAIKLDKALSKDQILNLYLNEIPYGGRIYGVEEASQNFFGKSSHDVTVSEAAYLAALAKAPSYYSPYGQHREALESRKNLVLKEMLTNNFLSQDDYNKAMAEVVTFRPKEEASGLKAPHFVFYIIDYLENKFGPEFLERGGFKVITTLDYDIQKKAEAVAKEYGDINETKFHAKNNGIVVIDPKTGDILAMVGSRNYFDTANGGNFNVTTAHRQPGSTFKPFVYSTLFNKGYTPSTVLFDVPTQFSSACKSDDLTSENGCYSPVDYDEKYRGPMTIRDALAQSINIPAVEALYLAGIQDSINLAHNMGIQGLADSNQYGLTLVLGGGEVTLLDMVSAYSTFANDGVRNPYNPVLRIEDLSGNVVQSFAQSPKPVLPSETARMISSILSDNAARTPAYGANSVLYFPDRQVAVKTGTTNDYKDAWIVGYTPNIAVGAWAGNNDNTPMDKKVSGYIIAPLWRALMDQILPNLPVETFPAPPAIDPTLKPVLRGIWQGGVSSVSSNGYNSVETVTGGVHSILYWVDKNNPRGPIPLNPASDPQFKNWEYSVRKWATENGVSEAGTTIQTNTQPAQPTQSQPRPEQNGAGYGTGIPFF